MSKKSLFLYLFLWCYKCLGQTEQAPFFRFFDEKDGLSSKVITALCKDSHGYLWIGTNYGLNRYDGYSFKHYIPDNRGLKTTNISNEYINDIKEDTNGFLWIATAEGLERYDPHTQTFRRWLNTGRTDGSLPNSLVMNILADEQDKIWLCCDARDLTFLDTKTFQFKTFPWKDFVVKNLPEFAAKPYKTIYWLERSAPNEMLLHSNVGLFQFNSATQEFKYLKKEQIEKPIFQNTTFQLPKSTAINAFFQEKNGTIWWGNDNGLAQYSPQNQHFIYTPIFPFSKKIEHNSSFSKVLYSKYNPTRKYVTAFYEGKVFVYEKEKLIKTITLPQGNTNLLYEDREANIWVNAGNHLFKINYNNLIIKELDVPKYLTPVNNPNTYFVEMCEDSEGNYWICNTHNWILRYSPSTNTWQKPIFKDNYEVESVTALLADKARKTIWIGAEGYGLLRYDEPTQNYTLYRQEEKEPDNSLLGYNIYDITKDEKGVIWVATSPGGLTRFDPEALEGKQFKTFNTQNGLPSNMLTSIQLDNNSNLWGATNRGLFALNTKTFQIKIFDKKQGIYNENIDMPLSKSSDGRLFFSTSHGIQSFEPDSLLKEEINPKILINSFKIFDKNFCDTLNINDLQKINLTWKENFFTFDFSSTNFYLPEKNEYAYRLIDFDAAWVECGKQHTAAYTNVPPGDYTLEIKTGRDGVFVPIAYRLGIHIEAPFWQKWWFKLLIVSFLVSVVYAIYSYRVGQIRKEAALKSEFQTRLAKVEMTALRAQMNPHFVFNCLSSINRFILVNQPDDASEYLTKFSRLIRLILDNSRNENVSLQQEIEALRLYIELEAMRFHNRFTYTINISEEVESAYLEIPPLLIQPYIENAIWHGLMHRESEGKLSINIFYKNEEELNIVIEDNGVGRAKAAELKSKSAMKHKSHGMTVTAERINMINQLYHTDTQVFITDLKNENGEGIGTRVSLVIKEK